MRRLAPTAAALLLAPALSYAQGSHAGHDHAALGASAGASAHAPAFSRRGADGACGECGTHGGEMTDLGRLRCETVLNAGGVQFWLTDSQSRPVAARGMRGVVSLRVAGNPKGYRYDLYPAAGETTPPNLLALPLDLSKVAGREVSVAARLSGVPGAGPEGVTLRRTAVIADPAELVVGTPVRAADADAAQIAAQKTCPVMDEPLGSMGVPWKIPVGDRAVFVCCKGCIKRVVADPANYVALLPPATRATDADAAAIAAQKTCPVMDEPLGSMGVPWKVPVTGGTVFVCCKGCIKRVRAEPAKYLAAARQAGGEVRR